MLAGGFRMRAESLLRAGQIDRARSDLQLDAQYVDSISNDATRALVRADVLLASGEVDGRFAPAAALGALAKAMDVFQGTEYRY
ncbi:hypothetical protein, partial [Escherichia coli]|uniref:hypothetical protein n=1 Tax=Escherichia coli TaxID=562 RepID=UPI0013AFA32D